MCLLYVTLVCIRQTGETNHGTQADFLEVVQDCFLKQFAPEPTGENSSLVLEDKKNLKSNS